MTKITTTVREVGQRFGTVAVVTVDGRAYESDVRPFDDRFGAINDARARAGLPAIEMEHPLAAQRSMAAEMAADRAAITERSLPSRRSR